MPDTAVRSGGLLRERMIIRRTAEMLVSAQPPDVLFTRVCDLLASQFGAHFVAIVEARNAKLHVAWSFSADGDSPMAAFDEIDVDDIDPLSSSLHAVGTERVVLFVPLRYGAGCAGFLALGGGVRRFSPEHVALLETCARYMAVAIHNVTLAKEKERLEALATRDALTGAFNRRVFDEHVNDEWRRAGRSGEPLSLIMIDVDYFKAYNDTYGHVAGDHCLQQIVQALMGCVSRSGDMVARYGGEEFVILLPNTPEQGAIDVAERMCHKVADLKIVHRGSELDRVSISAGVATIVPNADDRTQTLVAASDTALYRAKEGGRNRVATASYIENAQPARRRFEGRSNLPAQPTSFVGREAELATLSRALPTSAVISILGPGGVGKTRLAVAAGQTALPAFPGGAWLIEVGAERDGRRLPAMVASVVGVPSSEGMDALLSFLAGSPALIILDSCEHLIEGCRNLVEQIVRRCPDSRIITTSRQPLEFPGEVRLRLEPFAPSDAARLFLSRAKDVRPDFTLDAHDELYVREICRRVDCLPLGIELTAMRLGFMSLQQLAEHGGALGHPTDLHQRIAWGFDLLEPQERRFLARLSILPGPFDEDAARAVAGDDTDMSFELLTGLVEKSLVQIDLESGLYRLLTTISDYVRLRLEEFDDPFAVRAAAAKHYAAVVAELRAERAVTPAPVFARYASIRENVEAVLAWALLDGEDVENGAAIAADMAPYWIESGHLADARRFLEAAVARAPQLSRRRILDVLEWAIEVAAAANDPEHVEALAEKLRVETGSSNDGAEVARVMLGLALARRAYGRYEDAASLFHHASNAFRIAGDARNLCRSLLCWAEVVVEGKGDVPQALAMLDEAMDAARSDGSPMLLLAVVAEIVELWMVRGDELQAIEIIHDVEAQCQEFGDEASIGWTALLLARAELRRDEIVGRMHARDALERLRTHANPGRLAAAFEICARIAVGAEEFETAARLLAFATNLRHTHGVAGSLRERREAVALRETLEQRMDKASRERAMREGRAMSLDAAVSRALGDGKVAPLTAAGTLVNA